MPNPKKVHCGTPKRPTNDAQRDLLLTHAHFRFVLEDTAQRYGIDKRDRDDRRGTGGTGGALATPSRNQTQAVIEARQRRAQAYSSDLANLPKDAVEKGLPAPIAPQLAPKPPGETVPSPPPLAPKAPEEEAEEPQGAAAQEGGEVRGEEAAGERGTSPSLDSTISVDGGAQDAPAAARADTRADAAPPPPMASRHREPQRTTSTLPVRRNSTRRRRRSR